MRSRDKFAGGISASVHTHTHTNTHTHTPWVTELENIFPQPTHRALKEEPSQKKKREEEMQIAKCISRCFCIVIFFPP